MTPELREHLAPATGRYPGRGTLQPNLPRVPVYDICTVCGGVEGLCEAPWCVTRKPQAIPHRRMTMWPALWPVAVLAAFVAGFWVRG